MDVVIGNPVMDTNVHEKCVRDIRNLACCHFFLNVDVVYGNPSMNTKPDKHVCDIRNLAFCYFLKNVDVVGNWLWTQNSTGILYVV